MSSDQKILTVHNLDFNGLPTFQARVDSRDPWNVTMHIYEAEHWTDNGSGEFNVPSWKEHDIAALLLKWDGCGHLGFRDGEMGNEWVHVCGEKSLGKYLTMLQWAWNLARTLIERYSDDIGGGPADFIKRDLKAPKNE